jgi:hypothetical protein
MAVIVLILATVLLIVGSVLLLWFLIRQARRISYYGQTRRTTRAPKGVSYWSIILAIILLTFSWLFFWSGHRLKGFYVYQPQTRICRIDVSQNSDPVRSMKFSIWPPGDTLQAPPVIFLSGNAWHIKGQYIRVKGVLKNLFPGPYGFKLTDLYGGYAVSRPPANEQSTLIHQLIEGGPVDLESYLETMSFLRNSIQVGEFETQMVGITANSSYWIALSDSGVARLEVVGQGSK